MTCRGTRPFNYAPAVIRPSATLTTHFPRMRPCLLVVLYVAHERVVLGVMDAGARLDAAQADWAS